MTDLFPGTEMEVFEKYPASRRLDHPNFADVAKTTYAVGVITEFQSIADDPIAVEPMVKVEIAGAWESEFIPIFFQPKALYWDDEGVAGSAVEFEIARGLFKKAWMSFRCGDEVAVMIKEDVPVAVVGFADGVPRIGEDILKATATYPVETEHYQLSKIEEYTDGETGPDGLGLSLLLQASCVGYKTNVRISYGYYSFTTVPPNGWPSGISFFFYTQSPTSYTTIMWTIKIGPILYAIFGLKTQPAPGMTYNEYYWPDSSGIPSESYHPEWYDWETYNDALAPEFAYTNPPPVFGSGELFNSYVYPSPCRLFRLMVKAGVYSEQLEQDLLDSWQSGDPVHAAYSPEDEDWWPFTPSGMHYQTNLSTLLNDGDLLPQSKAGAGIDESFLQWFARPHTKAELEAAGMWPE